MIIYQADADESRSFATLGEAHAYLKAETGTWDAAFLKDATVIQYDVPTDKANVLRLINNEGGTHVPTGRSWRLTPRRGLTEVQ